MNRAIAKLSLGLLASFLGATSLLAQQMNYQGRLTDANGDPLPNGQYALTFSLFPVPTAGVAAWGPYIADGNIGTQGHTALAEVVNGRFNVAIGPLDTQGRSLQNSFSDEPYLELKVGDNAPMSPRQKLLHAPVALFAKKSQVAERALAADQVDLAGRALTAENADVAIQANRAAALGLPGQEDRVTLSGAKVGINNAAPREELDIHAVGSPVAVRLTTAASGEKPLYLQRNEDGRGFLLNGDAHSLNLGTNNGTDLTIDASGNVGIGRDPGTQDVFGTTVPMKLDVDGIVRASAFIETSDRNRKKNLISVDAADILNRVADLPLHRWTFKEEPDAVRHLGPMAQDFRAAFGLGYDDVTIATIDAQGVALAAIQGLNAKVESENAQLREENAELTARLERLEQAFEALVP